MYKYPSDMTSEFETALVRACVESNIPLDAPKKGPKSNVFVPDDTKEQVNRLVALGLPAVSAAIFDTCGLLGPRDGISKAGRLLRGIKHGIFQAPYLKAQLESFARKETTFSKMMTDLQLESDARRFGDLYKKRCVLHVPV